MTELTPEERTAALAELYRLREERAGLRGSADELHSHPLTRQIMGLVRKLGLESQVWGGGRVWGAKRA